MSIDSEWEKFHGGPAQPPHKKMHATIGPKRKILINGNLYRAWGKPEAVYLFYNRSRDQIALQPTSPRVPAAFPIRENRKCYEIAASSFCRHFNINISATHKFLDPDLTSDGKLILKLSETILVTRHTRRGERRKERQQ